MGFPALHLCLNERLSRRGRGGKGAAGKNSGVQLGSVHDSSLNLDAQISAVARSALAQLKLVCQLTLFLQRLDLARVTHALVTSWLFHL